MDIPQPLLQISPSPCGHPPHEWGGVFEDNATLRVRRIQLTTARPALASSPNRHCFHLPSTPVLSPSHWMALCRLLMDQGIRGSGYLSCSEAWTTTEVTLSHQIKLTTESVGHIHNGFLDCSWAVWCGVKQLMGWSHKDPSLTFCWVMKQLSTLGDLFTSLNLGFVIPKMKTSPTPSGSCEMNGRWYK